jgi:hypothetical protein
LTPSDALLVINFLNSPGGMFGAEGEASFWAFGGLDDRRVDQAVLDDPLRTHGTLDQPGDLGQIARLPVFDDAARTLVIDRILADEPTAEREEVTYAEQDLGLDLFSSNGGNWLADYRG